MTTIKPHFSDNRQILADVVPLRTPLSLMCEPSQICNIKCNYCMQSFITEKPKQLMTSSTFARLCTRISEFDDKLKQFNFAGWGEPLVNRELPNMVRYLNDCEITENIAIVTNGLLLTPELSLALVAAGTNHIRISLQGMTSEKYKEICGAKMDFQKFVDNVRFLYENKGSCQVSIKIADIALDNEEEGLLFYKIFGPIADRVYIESIRPMFAENKQDGKGISKYGFDHPPVIVCPTPFYMLNIKATGEIVPCCSYYKPLELGNIHDTSLRQVWEGEKMKWLQLMLLSGKRKEWDQYPVCRECTIPDAILTPGDELDEKAEEIRGRL